MNGIRIREYYKLAKPGIIYGNLITAIAAFAFSVHHTPHEGVGTTQFLAMVIGLGLAMASGCVLNNVFERDTDARMERTKKRALVEGRISVRSALLYAAVLGLIGFTALYLYSNLYALAVTIFGTVVYVCLYTPAKRRTLHSTGIGALAGAVPPVVGYVAVSNALDSNTVLLFIILICWQMPHFFAISLYRGDEYKNAGLPLLPQRIGRVRTEILMGVYALLFSAGVLVFGAVNQLSLLYFVPVSLAVLGWTGFALTIVHAKDHTRWARRMFLYSLIALLVFSASIAIA